MDWPLVLTGLAGSTAAGVATGVGALPVFFIRTLSDIEVVLGLALGAMAVQLVNRFAPHEHFVIGIEGVPAESLQRIWLIVIAIALHNIPEGLAVGVSFGGPDVANGTSAALGIGVQNLPEGLAVAAALASINYPRLRGRRHGVGGQRRDHPGDPRQGTPGCGHGIADGGTDPDGGDRRLASGRLIPGRRAAGRLPWRRSSPRLNG